MDIARLKKDLREMGLSERAVNPVVTAVQHGSSEKAKRLLLLIRSDLLNELHSSQNRLYRLDYILRELS